MIRSRKGYRLETENVEGRCKLIFDDNSHFCLGKHVMVIEEIILSHWSGEYYLLVWFNLLEIVNKIFYKRCLLSEISYNIYQYVLLAVSINVYLR